MVAAAAGTARGAGRRARRRATTMSSANPITKTPTLMPNSRRACSCTSWQGARVGPLGGLGEVDVGGRDEHRDGVAARGVAVEHRAALHTLADELEIGVLAHSHRVAERLSGPAHGDAEPCNQGDTDHEDDSCAPCHRVEPTDGALVDRTRGGCERRGVQPSTQQRCTNALASRWPPPWPSWPTMSCRRSCPRRRSGGCATCLLMWWGWPPT